MTDHLPWFRTCKLSCICEILAINFSVLSDNDTDNCLRDSLGDCRSTLDEVDSFFSTLSFTGTGSGGGGEVGNGKLSGLCGCIDVSGDKISGAINLKQTAGESYFRSCIYKFYHVINPFKSHCMCSIFIERVYKSLPMAGNCNIIRMAISCGMCVFELVTIKMEVMSAIRKI